MNLLANIQYDGTLFYGWQVQPGKPTVQGEVMRALEKLYGEKVPVKYTSRTDRGVHAEGQVITFSPPADIPAQRVIKALNRLLCDDVSVTGLRKCPDDFDPRYSVHSKMYAYRIFTGRHPGLTDKRYVWHLTGAVDWKAVRKGAGMIRGEHEFRLFSSSPEGHKTRINIISCGVTRLGDIYEIRIRAPFFRTYMVRYLAGFLIAIGAGKRHTDDLRNMLEGEGRRCTFCAPARGLVLRKIYFKG